MKTPQDAVDAYLRGDVNMTDLFVQLGRLASDTAGFVTSLPKGLLDELVQRLDGFPDTEEGWSRLRVFAITTWDRGVTREQVEMQQREEARLLRRSVEFGPGRRRRPCRGEAGHKPRLLRTRLHPGQGVTR